MSSRAIQVVCPACRWRTPVTEFLTGSGAYTRCAYCGHEFIAPQRPDKSSSRLEAVRLSDAERRSA